MRLLIPFLLVLNTVLPAIIVAQPTQSNLESEILTEETVQLSKEDIVRHLTAFSDPSADFNNRFQRKFTEKPGLAFISSAILPGSAQAANSNWFRAGLYMAVEAASIYFIIDYKNRAARGERNYERFVDNNWSVVQYANWLVDYHDYHGIDNPFIDDLQAMMDGVSASFNTSQDWNNVDIEILRSVERNTPYFTTDQLAANNFSHVLPAYGSQQYYELVAKYYQFQAGWSDYNTNQFLIGRAGGTASPLFFDGADRAQRFNDDFRTSRHFMILLISNHLISAFDAYFTFSVKQNRLEATPSAVPGRQIQFRYNF